MNLDMIQFISGEKGKGKTKILLYKVNADVNTVKGSIVYLDKNKKHMYELSNKVRLIDVYDYLVENSSEFIGFICGIISQYHDLEKVYIDSFLKVSFVNDDNLESICEKLEVISSKFNVDFVISISAESASLPETIKKNTIVAL